MMASSAIGRFSVPVPAFLFDLDCTLVDSVYQHVTAWQEALTECGIPCAYRGSTAVSA